MTIPNSFVAGDIASSSEVNDNFSHLIDILGNTSDEDHLEPAGDIVLGPRRAVQITAAGDGGPGADAGYVQISWNAELFDAGGGVFRLRRYVTGEGGAALRVGGNGVEILTTSDETTELTTAMDVAVAVRADDDNPYIYINPEYHFVSVDAPPNPQAQNSYRLNYVPIAPVQVIAPGSAGGGTATFTASQYLGVPVEAKAIEVYAAVIGAAGATVTAPCVMRVLQANQGVIVSWFGLVLRAQLNEEFSTRGIVPLGFLGVLRGKFTVDFNVPPLSKALVITGYFI